MVHYYPRLIEAEVLRWLERGKSVVLVGPRQAGKTTLLRHLAEERGWEYLTLDSARVLRELRDPDSFADLHSSPFLLDEAQYDEEIGRKLKYLHDVRGMRFVVSGSGSFDIKVRVTGELVGRAARLELLPLSFSEYVLWKDRRAWEVYRRCSEAFRALLSGKPVDFPVEYSSRLEELWREYVVFGGYPEVALAQTAEDKTETMRQIAKAYIDRDIIGFLGVREYTKFTRLVEYLAAIVSTPLVKAGAQRAAGISYPTLEAYLSLLIQTFVVFEVRPAPLFRSAMRRSSKFYFYDQGMLNHFRGLFDPISARNDAGELLENFVARQLLEYTDRLFFYRSESGGEVDFIVGRVPVEVKMGRRAGKAAQTIAARMGTHVIVISPGPAEKKKNVYFVPPWYL